ncbi:MAG: hypothetical protein Q4A41_01890 [Bacillota bacterium]|nr:hypothetical protein [Bacillota bacterium]
MSRKKQAVKRRRGLYVFALSCIFGFVLYFQSDCNTGYAQQTSEHVHEFRLRKAVWLTGYDDDHVFHEDVNIKSCECGEIITVVKEDGGSDIEIFK